MTQREQLEMLVKGKVLKGQLEDVLDAAEAVYMPSRCDKSDKAVMDAYMAKLKLKKYSQTTINRYRITLDHFVEYNKEHKMTIAMANYEYISKYLMDYSTREVNASGLNFVRTVLNGMYSFLVRERWISENPVARIDKIKEPKRKKRAFTDKEVDKIRKHITDPRNRAIFELMISSGLRKSEVAALKIKDIDFNALSVHVASGKGDKERESLFDETTKKYLKKYLKYRTEHTEDDYLFTRSNSSFIEYSNKKITASAISTIFGFIKRDLNLEVCSAHICRHKFATDCYTKRKMKVEYISDLMGHSSTAVTMRYIDIDHKEAIKQYRKAS